MIEKKRLESYLAFIKNSVGSEAYREYFASVDGKLTDVAQDGELSCAYFVSSVLKMFDLLGAIHLTVGNTVKDMISSGWKETEQPRPGCVIVWDELDGYEHIGFYVGQDLAVSNGSSKKKIISHDWKYAGERRIKAVYLNEGLYE